jgi:hypothetical protein
MGIAVDARLMERLRRRGHWQLAKVSERVAPVQMLKDAIDTWNSLIDLVEAQFIVPMRDKVERWNVQSRTDLKSLRKQMPAEIQLEDLNEE